MAPAPHPAEKVWFITGCSSGIGRALAEKLIGQQYKVVATARDVTAIEDLAKHSPDKVQALRLDLLDSASTQAAVKAALARFGQIDVLVNNAGVGLLGGVEECSATEVEQQFRLNVFGTLEVIRAVLPSMRARRQGHILTVTSVGGISAVPGYGIYCGSKFALEGIHESLAQELAPLNIAVTTLAPGVIATNFRGRSHAHAAKPIADYEETVGKMRVRAERGYTGYAGDPASAAAAIIHMVTCGRPAPLRLALGSDAVERIRAKGQDLLRTLEEWEDVSRSITAVKS